MQNSPLLKVPNPLLEQPTKKVADINASEVKETIALMRQTMLEDVVEGTVNVGISANQIGVPLRICAIETEGYRGIMINPKITMYSKEKDIETEGCMSVPGTFVPIERPISVNVQFIDENGEKKKLRAKHFLARVIQHELDHLAGIVILDRNGEKWTEKPTRKKSTQEQLKKVL